MAVNPFTDGRRRRITEITVVGTHCVGAGTDGELYRFDGRRWTRLELVTAAARRARRVARRTERQGMSQVSHA